jgi:hypothetical protein
LAERVPAAAIVAFAAAKKAVKWGLSVLPAAPTAVEYTGVIDFAQERSIYNCGTFWKLFAPGRDYVGKPGAWEADEHDGITCYEPFWLLRWTRMSRGMWNFVSEVMVAGLLGVGRPSRRQRRLSL